MALMTLMTKYDKSKHVKLQPTFIRVQFILPKSNFMYYVYVLTSLSDNRLKLFTVYIRVYGKSVHNFTAKTVLEMLV